MRAAVGPMLTEIANGTFKVVDLTAPLSERTPVIKLPPPFVNTKGMSLELISRYDDRGPICYWNNITVGEHAGTHFDAPAHWVTGRELATVDEVPLKHLVAPAIVIDKTEECKKNADCLLELADMRAWQDDNGPLPDGGWLLFRTGWSERAADEGRFLNIDETGPHTPGPSAECARWIAEESPLIGFGVETVGTDAGIAGTFNPPFPLHSLLLGKGKYGLASLVNLDQLAPSGNVIFVAPLKIVGGSGSPARVIAFAPQ